LSINEGCIQVMGWQSSSKEGSFSRAVLDALGKEYGFDMDTPFQDYPLVKAQGFAKLIVLVNSSNAIELGFLEDGVDAALWVGSPGAVGFNAVGRALTGEVNPSGRLVDTYAYDLSTAPAFWNAGDFTYGNLNTRHYVEYAEGIYVGYRYYETAAADGFIDYDSTVQYPFGYGLSYTSFEQSIEAFADGGGTIAMQVKVTNTGAVAGKDVVQVYYTAPYTKGGIEKAQVVLAGFAKTGELAPGASETVTVAFTEEDMASFDAFGAGCYVLEAGDYEIKLMNNAHDVIDSRTHTVKDTVVYGEGHPRATDKTAAVAHFADVQDGQITVYVSRSDWAVRPPRPARTARLPPTRWSRPSPRRPPMRSTTPIPPSSTPTTA
jgi:beta-glucosidase